ncbi:MAG: SurA N-terminal domain-containing protein [Bacillota bacterium]|nr:SurA N-terminal domain-containing protein [Bacillota bacterium]
MKRNLFSRKTALFALLLAAALILSGCNLVVKDPKVDAKQIIIKVNDETITKEQFNVYYDRAYEQAQSQQQQMQQYGYPAQPVDKKALLDSTIQSVVSEKVLRQKAQELKLDEFTEEELAELAKDAKDNYQDILDQVKMYYFGDSELTGEELDQAIAQQAQEFGFSEEMMLENARENKTNEKLVAYAGKDIEITEDDIKAEYEKKVQAEKDAYAQDLGSFGENLASGVPVYYTPAGYRYVRQILIPLAEEDQTALRTLESEKGPLEAEVTTAQGEVNRYLTALGAEEAEEKDKALVEVQAAALNEEEKAKLDELMKAEALDQAAVDALLHNTPVYQALAKAKEALNSKIDEIKAREDEAFAKIQEKTDAVYQQAIAEGADFDALVKENDNDPGQPEKGYPVCESTISFMEAFTKGAMALEKIGDISQPVRTSYGYHILKYTEEIQEGATALDSVHDLVKDELFNTRQDEAYTKLKEQWIGEAKVETYPERMEN